MSPDPQPEPLVKMLSIMSLELRASMLATQDNVPEAEKLFARARQEEKDLGYREPPFYIRPVAESEAAAMMTAGKWSEAKAASDKRSQSVPTPASRSTESPRRRRRPATPVQPRRPTSSS